MSETLFGLYPQFLDAGYSPDFFWSLSPGEVEDCLESYIRRLKREAEEWKLKSQSLIVMLYKHAQQSANMLNASLSKNGPEVLSLHDYYPDLFDDPKAIENDNQELQLLQYKAAMENFSMRFNKKFIAEGGENDGG